MKIILGRLHFLFHAGGHAAENEQVERIGIGLAGLGKTCFGFLELRRS